MNVGSAGRLSAGDQPSLNISGLTWERTHRSLSVTQILFMTPAICPRERDTAGPSATVQNLFSSGQFGVMKNPGDALNAGKLSLSASSAEYQKIQAAEKPYKCQDCGKAGSGVSHTQHHVTGVGEKPQLNDGSERYLIHIKKIFQERHF